VHYGAIDRGCGDLLDVILIEEFNKCESWDFVLVGVVDGDVTLRLEMVDVESEEFGIKSDNGQAQNLAEIEWSYLLFRLR
jgi:hypothetical protein